MHAKEKSEMKKPSLLSLSPETLSQQSKVLETEDARRLLSYLGGLVASLDDHYLAPLSLRDILH